MSPGLKILLRRIERVVILLVALTVLAMLGLALLGPRYLAYRFTPRIEVETPAELEAAIETPLDRFTLHKAGRSYTLAIGPMVMWALPEGPPMYIFRPEGGLVDFTTDVGDAPEFSARWISGSDFDSLGWSPSDSIR